MNPPTLHAHRTGLPARYEIVDGETAIACVPARTLLRGGEIVLDDDRYALTCSALGRDYRMRTTDGRPVASGHRSGRTDWTIEAGGRSYRFARESSGGTSHVLAEDGTQIGRVHRSGRWSRDTEADLPGIDRAEAVFVLILALATRQRRRRRTAVAIGR